MNYLLAKQSLVNLNYVLRQMNITMQRKWTTSEKINFNCELFESCYPYINKL